MALTLYSTMQITGLYSKHSLQQSMHIHPSSKMACHLRHNYLVLKTNSKRGGFHTAATGQSGANQGEAGGVKASSGAMVRCRRQAVAA